MYRSNVYDALPSTLENLSNKFSQHKEALDNILEKADVNDKDSLQSCVDLYDEVNDLCKSVYRQFCALRTDYNSGLINLKKYRVNLESIKSLLTERGEKITNKNLHVEEMVAELKKHF